MNKVILVIAEVVVGYFINIKFVGLAYSLGFAELKKEAVLVNAEKMKIKCHSYALGCLNEIKLENELENKFQACINEHQANGYKIIESSNT